MWRKFCLCGLLRFIEPESATQIVVGVIFCVMYLSLIAYLTPAWTTRVNARKRKQWDTMVLANEHAPRYT